MRGINLVLALARESYCPPNGPVYITAIKKVIREPKSNIYRHRARLGGEAVHDHNKDEQGGNDRPAKSYKNTYGNYKNFLQSPCSPT